MDISARRADPGPDADYSRDHDEPEKDECDRMFPEPDLGQEQQNGQGRRR
jgi:hypothetical protein